MSPAAWSSNGSRRSLCPGGGEVPICAVARRKSQRDASAPGYVEDSVDDALRLMRRLRDAGIRSHFWV